VSADLSKETLDKLGDNSGVAEIKEGSRAFPAQAIRVQIRQWRRSMRSSRRRQAMPTAAALEFLKAGNAKEAEPCSRGCRGKRARIKTDRDAAMLSAILARCGGLLIQSVHWKLPKGAELDPDER